MSIWDGDGGEPVRERSGGRVVVVLVLVLALLAGGGYAAAYAFAGDRVPRGTTVAGVDVGGLTRAEAEVALEDGLRQRAEQPIVVDLGDQTTRLDPVAAGLSVDYPGSVAEAGGRRSWEPQALWDYYTGGNDLDALVRVDDTRMAAAVNRLEKQLGATAVDGAIRFTNNATTRVTQPKPGQGLTFETTRDILRAAYLDDTPATLALSPVTPDIDDGDIRTALDSFANPALAGSVVLRFGQREKRLQPAQYAPLLRLVPSGGVLVPRVDRQGLAALVADATRAAGPVDATIRLVDGRPQVVPAKPGSSYRPAQIASALLRVLPRTNDKRRTIEVKATEQQADVTTRDARRLGVKEKVSEFTTYFPYAEYRNVNLGQAADYVDGTLLEPGETFSLNDTTGERTVANGFTEGTIISDGVFVEDLGGGVSQMATTLFNAMFFAGLEDVEHRAHSLYIDRYPVGREATVVFGSLDLSFRNDTKHGVLINADVTPSTPSSQGVVTVRMYSTKVWDITSQASDRYAYVQPGMRRLRTPGCAPNTGFPGFQIDVTRVFRRAGQQKVVRREKFHTDYDAGDTVICLPPRGGRGPG